MGRRRAAEALLAFADDEPAGFAVYFHTYSTFLGRRGMYLHDLYVSPAYRRHGLGTQLLRRVAAIAVERGCGRFEWVALDWNTDAHRFYEDLGAEMLPEWRTFRVVGDSLRELSEEGEIVSGVGRHTSRLQSAATRGLKANHDMVIVAMCFRHFPLALRQYWIADE